MQIVGLTVQDRPADLDAQLLAATGCDAAEVAHMLATNPIAGLVANALAPFLADGERKPAPDLAEIIEQAGVGETAALVHALYAPADAPAEGEPEA